MRKNIRLNVFDLDVPNKIQDIQDKIAISKKRCKYGISGWEGCQYHVGKITAMLEDIAKLRSWAKMKGIALTRRQRNG